MTSWAHEQVSYCLCSELKYVHAHCPCYNCNGKAVSRATEYRHWVETNLEGNCAGHAQFESDPQDSYVTIESYCESTDSTSTVFESESACRNDLPIVSSPDISDAAVSSPIINDDLQLQSTNKISNTCQSKFGKDINNDIAIAVLRAFGIMDDMGRSQKNMLQILEFGKECYCKGNHEMSESWPNSWSTCMKTLVKAGYKDPNTHYICLNESHPNLWNISNSSKQLCRFCNQVPSIQFHYLPLAEKIHQWCSDEIFCNKMTVHWTDHENWLYDYENNHDQIMIKCTKKFGMATDFMN